MENKSKIDKAVRTSERVRTASDLITGANILLLVHRYAKIQRKEMKEARKILQHTGRRSFIVSLRVLAISIRLIAVQLYTAIYVFIKRSRKETE